MSYTYALPLLAGGGAFALDGQPGVATKHYLLGGKRIAQREGRAGPVTYLYHDHLGSAVASSEQESARYWPYGDTRAGAVSTAYKYTGQELDAASGLYYYRARWYDASIGRFIQADSIVPAPGNPQSLNRYAYVYNNPLRYTDPSGHDPLDSVWQSEFQRVHGREPAAEDILIRLFSIAFPNEWDWSAFYDARGGYIPGSLERVFRDNRPAEWTWEDVPGALDRLAGWYGRGENRLYTRDIGSLFGGLPNRFETPSAWSAVSDANNPIRVWVYLNRTGLPPYLVGTSDSDANVHHWAWCLTMGAAYGPGATLINTGREITQFRGDWRNTWSDIMIGTRGAGLGLHFQLLGLNDNARAWHLFMFDRFVW